MADAFAAARRTLQCAHGAIEQGMPEKDKVFWSSLQSSADKMQHKGTAMTFI